MGQPPNIVQPQSKRVKNFTEVSLGYSKKLATEESKRCLQCSDPVCLNGCPLGINIPGFIRVLREGNAAAALEKIREESSFPSVCGRICSAPCEAACVLIEEDATVGIRALERYAADAGKPKFLRRKQSVCTGPKIAIIGSGPAGLTAAARLAAQGYRVTVFESWDKAGGVLRYGIPAFRLPKNILDNEINEIKAMGVDILTNCHIGTTLNFEDLSREGFESVLLATGSGVPRFSKIPGVHYGGVYYGEEFLMRVASGKGNLLTEFPLGQKVAVVGFGNSALDCARAAVRLGRQATVLAPKPLDDKKLMQEESRYGQEEGVKFESPVEVLEIDAGGDRFVQGIRCVRLDYADIHKKGQWELVPVPDSEFVFEADTVILALGHGPNTLAAKTLDGLKLNDDGTVWTDQESGMTSVAGVFACGNVVTNAGPVVQAMAAGKSAAGKIDLYLKQKQPAA